ncbi:MAG: DUF4112 domain-containing protein [Brooklawnia sp.]|uniref:DUF4112 domain-containing protein n=1 Tax=Brooklawnia sp. TaxID=2699740 RepID=UPI003C771A14
MEPEPVVDAPVVEPTAVLDAQPGVSRASKSLALVLDDLVRIPGTDVGVGLDGVVGLIPGIGDATTTTVAAVILGDAVRNRVPLPVLARMGVNLGADALLGLIPGLGDLFDVAHRANRKNLRLLQRSINDRQRTRQRSVVYLIVAVSMVVGILAVLLAALLWSLWLLWQLITPR